MEGGRETKENELRCGKVVGTAMSEGTGSSEKVTLERGDLMTYRLLV